MKNLLAAFLAVTILFSCSSVPSSRSPASRPGRIPFKVLTLNVWDVGFAAGELTDHRLKAICERLREESAKQPGEGWDLVLVQELWPWTRYNQFRNCGFPYVATVNDYKHTFGSWTGRLMQAVKGDGIDTGLYVLSRYPLLNPERHTYSVNGKMRYALSDGDYLANKAAMFVAVAHPKAGVIQVFDTHLVSRNAKENYNMQRRKQLQELGDFVAQTAEPAFPLLLGGDFNFGPPPSQGKVDPMFLDEQAWHDLLPRLFPNLQRVGGIEFFCTYCVSRNFFARYANPEEVDQSIDHIFTSPDIEVGSFRPALDEEFGATVKTKDIKPKIAHVVSVDQTGVDPGYTAVKMNYSDHFGFEAVLWLKEADAPDRVFLASQKVGTYCKGTKDSPAWCNWSEFRKVR